MVLRNYWYQIRLHSRAARSMYHGAKIRLPTPQYLHSAVSPRPLPPGLAHEEPQQPRLPRSGQSLRRRLFLGPEAVWSRPGRPRNRLAQPLSVRRHFAPAPPIVLHMGVGTCLHALQQEYFPAHKLYGAPYSPNRQTVPPGRSSRFTPSSARRLRIWSARPKFFALRASAQIN